jgi:tRNA wybutosine-synthesizing protein 1
MMPERDKYGDVKGFKWGGPIEIADGLVKAQKTLVAGYGGNPEVKRALYVEALSPKHVALSLTGEPTMYPKMDELLSEFHSRGMTTFVVTNGTLPEAVAKWKTLPTQFYVSMVAPNEEVYQKFIRPSTPGLWKKYKKTLYLACYVVYSTLFIFLYGFGNNTYNSVLKHRRQYFYS